MEKPENLITVRLLMQGKEVGSIIGKVRFGFSIMIRLKKNIYLNSFIFFLNPQLKQKGDNIKSIREQVNYLPKPIHS